MQKSIIQVFPRLLPLLLGSPGPSQGLAVDVPPPTTVTVILGFIAGSAGKVSYSFRMLKAQTAMMILAFDPDVLYDQSGGWRKCKCDPGCCWTEEHTECPA